MKNPIFKNQRFRDTYPGQNKSEKQPWSQEGAWTNNATGKRTDSTSLPCYEDWTDQPSLK